MSLVDRPCVVLVTGISAAGKSTVAERLAGRWRRGVHVRGDVFRRMIVAGRAAMTDDLDDDARRQLELRYRLGAEVADAYAEAGFSVVVQDIVLGDDLPRYARAIRSRPLHVVVLAPRLDAILRREEGRPKTAYADGMATAAALDRALREQTPRLGLWLDTSDQTPDETVDEIARRADESRIA